MSERDAALQPPSEAPEKSPESGKCLLGEPEALGLEPEVRATIIPRGGSIRDVTIAALSKDGNEKSYLLASDVDKGLRHYEIGSGKDDVKKLPSWQYASREKGSIRMKKGGIVSSVCALADGRVAVSIIDRHRVLLLRWSPVTAGGESSMTATAGSWIVAQKIKLRCDPYRIDALGSDMLAVAGTEAEQKPVSFLGSSSKWGPGPQVALAYVSSSPVRLVQCGELKFKAVAISLADGLLIAASSDAVADESNKLCSYLVEAYKLPERPDGKTRGPASSGQKPSTALVQFWSCMFDEQVQDVCAVPCKTAVYVVLPDSRRVAALDLRTGEWLVDVLDCGSSRPIRIDIAPRQRQPCDDSGDTGQSGSNSSVPGTPKAAILYADSSISVHRVGVFS